MEREPEWKMDHEAKSFDHAYDDLSSCLKEHAPHKTDDTESKFLHQVYREGADEMLTEAREAYQRKKFDRAWYFLVRAARDIGYLMASQNAVYPHADEPDLRSALRAGGRKGGKMGGGAW